MIRLSLKPLFLGATTRETIEMNKKCDINYNIPELKDCDKNAIDLMKKMLEKDPNLRIDPKSALKHPYFKSLDTNFDEDLIVPEDTPTQIEAVIKKFQQETFDMSRINSLINSSLRQQIKQQSQEQSTCISNTSTKSLQMLNTLNNNMQPPTNAIITTNNMQLLSNTSCLSNQNSPMIGMQESTHSDYDSRSQYSNFKQKESINDSELNFVNKNQNVYGYISKQFISQSSFETEQKSPSFIASESSIICRQESLNSNYSLKMKAHNTKQQKEQGNPIRYRAQSVDDNLDPAHQNNLLNPNGAPEGRTKSPSKFKIDFERSRASSDQFEHLNQIDNLEETSKEAEQHTPLQQVPQLSSPKKKNIAREAAALSKEENKLKFKKGTLDEQFYNDQNLL